MRVIIPPEAPKPEGLSTKERGEKKIHNYFQKKELHAKGKGYSKLSPPTRKENID